ncbi:hypothetical protein OCOJLMKI_1748 [Methylobacterium iners]|uniref:Uncharacterized protein n=1 Tax=Methylobacterium iners TaxID=418707 RepID=A0ABQ4RYF8_9HYPH|nr:hypothetical protein OCOJLMKI_1748 [Methylobacterium iners]
MHFRLRSYDARRFHDGRDVQINKPVPAGGMIAAVFAYRLSFIQGRGSY